MSSFASYAFNKSHAAAYAYVAYQTAYLKCHYFKQYTAALMTSCLDSTGKILEYMDECSKQKIKILTPDINESGAGFVPTENGIRFALAAVKNLGYNSINEIIAERKRDGKFTSLENFCKRISGKEVNRRAVEGLKKCSTFDGIELNRREMLENYDRIFSGVQEYSMRNMEGQINFFDMSGQEEASSISINRVPEYSLAEKLEMEKEVIGIYLSGHPLQSYSAYSELCRMNRIAQLYDETKPIKNNAEFSFFCTVQNVKQHTQKNGSRMAFVDLEDMTGEVEGLVFAEAFASCRELLQRGRAVHIAAKVSFKDDAPKLIVQTVTAAEKYAELCGGMTLYIKCRSDGSEKLQELLSICRKHLGTSRTVFYFEDIKQQFVPKNISGVKVCGELAEEILAAAGQGNAVLK